MESGDGRRGTVIISLVPFSARDECQLSIISFSLRSSIQGINLSAPLSSFILWDCSFVANQAVFAPGSTIVLGLHLRPPFTSFPFPLQYLQHASTPIALPQLSLPNLSPPFSTCAGLAESYRAPWRPLITPRGRSLSKLSDTRIFRGESTRRLRWPERIQTPVERSD